MTRSISSGGGAVFHAFRTGELEETAAGEIEKLARGQIEVIDLQAADIDLVRQEFAGGACAGFPDP